MVSEEGFRAFIAICALGGVRLGEAAALQFDDIDYQRQQLPVHRQVQRAGGKQVEIRWPKYGAERTVPMPDELVGALGHAKASTTLDTYAKLWPSGEDRTRRAASSLARQVLGENVGVVWAERPETASDLALYTLKRNESRRFRC